MRHDPRAHIQDCLNMCEEIRVFTKGITYQQFIVDILVRRACERCFSILGEALNRLRKDRPDYAQRIESFHDIIGFRNRIVHGYDTIDYGVVWTAITEGIPRFQEVIRPLLLELAPPVSDKNPL